MTKQELEQPIGAHTQEGVDSSTDADQEIVWQGLFRFIDEKVENIIEVALDSNSSDEQSFQEQLRLLVIESYQKGQSYQESRSVPSDLLITYVARAFEYNEVLFSKLGVTNILKNAAVI